MTIGDVLSQPLRVSWALEGIRDDVKAVERARNALDVAIAQRDASIRDAAENGIAYPALGRITGLSRQRLWRIINGGTGATE